MIPFDIRFAIARANDLALDGALAGRYSAYTYFAFSETLAYFELSTMPRGKKHTDPESQSLRCELRTITHPGGWDGMDRDEAVDHCRGQVAYMITHLEALLAEGPADTQEGLS